MRGVLRREKEAESGKCIFLITVFWYSKLFPVSVPLHLIPLEHPVLASVEEWFILSSSWASCTVISYWCPWSLLCPLPQQWVRSILKAKEKMRWMDMMHLVLCAAPDFRLPGPVQMWIYPKRQGKTIHRRRALDIFRRSSTNIKGFHFNPQIEYWFEKVSQENVVPTKHHIPCALDHLPFNSGTSALIALLLTSMESLTPRSILLKESELCVRVILTLGFHVPGYWIRTTCGGEMVA